MQIAILNHSTKVSDADAALMTQACAYQLTHHVAPKWAMIPVPVVFYPKGAILPSNARPIVILDRADTAGALGYHTEEGGKIWGRIFCNPVLENGGVILYDHANPQNTSVSSVLSHEIVEMFVDPYINSWSDGPSLPQGSEYALEACDPVESDSYVVSVGPTIVSVSNFICPHWSDAQCKATSGYDFLNNLKAPFTMTPGGYMVIRRGPGTEQQVYGETHPMWRRDMKASHVSRTATRCGSKSA